MLTRIRALAARVRAFATPRACDRDFDQELESHLAMLAEDKVGRGMTPEQAHRSARIELGGLSQLREAHRESRGLPLVDAVLNDLRYALRALRKDAGLTAVAVMTLATGIGVNTAVFTAYNAVALRPIQAPEPHRMVQITRSNGDDFYSYPDYAYYRDNSKTFSGLAAMGFGHSFSMGEAGSPPPTDRSIVAGAAGFRFPRALAGSPERASSIGISGNYFRVLGVHPAIGRMFLPEEDGAKAAPVALVSQNFWERRFARDPGLLGRHLTLNGVRVTIVGITSRDFSGTWPIVPDFWLPLSLQSRLASPAADLIRDRNSVCCRVYGRLPAGTEAVSAEAEMNALAARLEFAFPARQDGPTRERSRLVFVPASPFGHPDARATAFAMAILAAVGLILLIACANVASLLLARSATRQREIAIRLAIGAGRGRILRQLLTEYAVLSLLAGATGVLLSWWSLRFLMVQIAAALPNYLTVALHVAPDYRVLMYTLFLSMAATVASGLLPALRASSPNLTAALKDEGSTSGGFLRKSLLRDWMVGAQVSVCLVLLIAAGLLTRTSQRALQIDLGFDYRNISMLHVSSPAATTSPAQLAARRTQLAQRLASLPEIQSVAAASRVPLGGGIRAIAVSINGASLYDPGTQSALYNLVTPGYFATMGIPILRGRNFTAQESRGGDNFDGSPAIVSEATAKLFWPGQDPLGKQFAFGPGRNNLRFSGEGSPHSVSSVVIGVAKDVRSVSLKGVDQTCLYLPVTVDRGGTIFLRARGNEGKALAAVQHEFEASRNGLEGELLDSRTAFTNQAGFVASRMGAIGSAIIGALGLLMASVGIYGTVGFVVTQRTQEIGIRMALGAQRWNAMGLVLTETMRPVAIGLTAGFVGAAIVSRLMSSYLFGLSSLDSVAFLGAAGVLMVSALLAGYLPARRATWVEPMTALRHE